MTMTVRRCMKCGREDLSRHWSSMDDAASQGALRQDWACPSCAWTEAELVDSTGDAPRSDRGVLTGDADEDRREPVPVGDPQRPVDPDEARRNIPPVGVSH